MLIVQQNVGVIEMLYNYSNQPIYNIPHRQNYDVWRSRISDEDYQAIFDELASKIEILEVFTSGWLPGSDWTGTVYAPIYEACERNFESAAKFYGLILWDVVMHDENNWSFDRYPPNRGLTYFRIN